MTIPDLKMVQSAANCERRLRRVADDVDDRLGLRSYEDLIKDDSQLKVIGRLALLRTVQEKTLDLRLDSLHDLILKMLVGDGRTAWTRVSDNVGLNKRIPQSAVSKGASCLMSRDSQRLL